MKQLTALLVLSAFSLLLSNCSSSPDTSPEGMKAIFGENQSQTDACYKKTLKKEPDMGSGTVELKFHINEEGKAYKTMFMKKKSTLNNKLLNACLKKVVSGWQFPAGKATQVAYDFNFVGEGDDSTPSADEPQKQTDLDVIDTTPQDEGGSGDEETPTE
jgi:hypothetical protein